MSAKRAQAFLEEVVAAFDEPAPIQPLDDGDWHDLAWAAETFTVGCASNGYEHGVAFASAWEAVESPAAAIDLLSRIFDDELVFVGTVAHGEDFGWIAPRSDPALHFRELDPDMRRAASHVWIWSWSGECDQSIIPKEGDAWMPKSEPGIWSRVN